MSKILTVYVASGTQAVWTADANYVLSSVTGQSTGADMMISAAAESSLNDFQSDNVVTDSYISVMFSYGSTVRQTIPLGREVLEGESIYFSANGSALFVCTLDSQL